MNKLQSAVPECFRPATRRFLALTVTVFCLSGCVSMVRTPAFMIHRESKNPQVLRGAYHVHSKYSRGTKASLKRIIAAAEKNDLDFVVITDHDNRDAARDYGSNTYPKKPLLIIGEEISLPDGHMTAIGVHATAPKGLNSQAMIDWIHQEGGYAFLAHPVSVRNPWRDWQVSGYDGLEIHNASHTFSANHKLLLPFKMALLPDSLFLKSIYKNPGKALMLWSGLAQTRRVNVISAVDAHLRQSWFGFDPENYALQIQSSTLHVLSRVLEEKFVTSAIGLGRSFVVMEFLGHASEFSFSIFNGNREFFIGDTLKLNGSTTAKITVPKKSELRFYRDAKLIAVKKSKEMFFDIKQKAAYRVEVYRGGKLWIISNFIYVE